MVKYLLRKAKAQELIITYLSILVLAQSAAALSTYTSSLICTLFLASVAIMGSNVLVISIIIQIYQKDCPDHWVQLNSFACGVGGICGPFFVSILKLKVFLVLGAAHLLPLIALLLYPLPTLN